MKELSDRLEGVIELGLLLLLLLGFVVDSELLQDPLALITGCNSGVRVVEEGGERVKFLKREVIGPEVDVEGDAEGASSDESDESAGSSQILLELLLSLWLPRVKDGAEVEEDAIFFLRNLSPLSSSPERHGLPLRLLVQCIQGDVTGTTQSLLRSRLSLSLDSGLASLWLQSLPEVGQGNVVGTSHVVRGCLIVVRGGMLRAVSRLESVAGGLLNGRCHLRDLSLVS